MQNKNNNCGERIDYELPDCVDESHADLYWSAAVSAEDALAIITKMQNDRKDESGNICEPITSTDINTFRELNYQYLTPAFLTLATMERCQK